MKVLEKLDYAV